MRVLVLLVLLWAGFSFGETSEPDGLRSQADQGDVAAQHNLGVMYAAGRGVPEDNVPEDNVPEDNVLGYMWANLAGANGYDVSKLKEVLVEQMTKADLSKAEDLTRQYIKDNSAVLSE